MTIYLYLISSILTLCNTCFISLCTQKDTKTHTHTHTYTHAYIKVYIYFKLISVVASERFMITFLYRYLLVLVLILNEVVGGVSSPLGAGRGGLFTIYKKRNFLRRSWENE